MHEDHLTNIGNFFKKQVICNFFSINVNSAGCRIAFKRNYFNLTESFVLMLCKMAAKQTEYSRLELRSVINFLVAEKCKSCEIYKRMCDVH